MSQIQISLDVETVKLLDQAVAKSATTREQWLREAIVNYSSHEKALREELEKGLRDIEAGRVISDSEMELAAEQLLATFDDKNSDSYEEWFCKQVELGIQDADAGNLITQQEIDEVADIRIQRALQGREKR